MAEVLDGATLAKVRKVLTDGTSVNTRRAYATDLRHFAAWRQASGFQDLWPVPPEVLMRFVVERVEGLPTAVGVELAAQGFKSSNSWSTIERRVAALATAHQTRNLPSPTAHPLVSEVVGRASRTDIGETMVEHPARRRGRRRIAPDLPGVMRHSISLRWISLGEKRTLAPCQLEIDNIASLQRMQL